MMFSTMQAVGLYPPFVFDRGRTRKPRPVGGELYFDFKIWFIEVYKAGEKTKGGGVMNSLYRGI